MQSTNNVSPSGDNVFVYGSTITVANPNSAASTINLGRAGGSGAQIIIAGTSSGSTLLQAAAAASGTLTLPAATDTLVGRATTDILTSKTLTSPLITAGTPTASNAVGFSGNTLNWGDGASSHVAVSTDQGQTLTNKTIAGASNTLTARIANDVSGLGAGVGAALGAAVNATGGIPTPTPTRAGDIIYWNGSNWVALAGNNSGTLTLQENGSGVPSWASVAGTGTVTSVVCGTGLTGGTITTTGTCAVSLTTASNVLGADVALNNTANYFDGPSMAQGTSGTWWVSGTVTLTDTATAANFNCKLWDGTTVIASTNGHIEAANVNQTASLSGFLASPAANIRISCKDVTATTGKIIFNFTGNSKDSSIWGHRIQ